MTDNLARDPDDDARRERILAAMPEPAPGKLQKILVGGAVSMLTLIALYGPQSAFQMLALSVICTAGIGLIPILFVFWLVGGIAIHVYRSIRRSRGAAATT